MEIAFRSCWASQRNDGLKLINHDTSRSEVLLKIQKGLILSRREHIQSNN